MSVLVVRRGGFDGGAEYFVPEELADMGNCAALDEKGVVGEGGDVHVGQKMGVDRTAVVMAWENGVECGDALGVGRLDAAEVGAVVSA